MIGKIVPKNTMMVLAASPMPNQSITSGIRAALGIGKIRVISGPAKSSTARWRAMMIPRDTPNTTAVPNPANCRLNDDTRLSHKVAADDQLPPCRRDGAKAGHHVVRHKPGASNALPCGEKDSYAQQDADPGITFATRANHTASARRHGPTPARNTSSLTSRQSSARKCIASGACNSAS